MRFTVYQSGLFHLIVEQNKNNKQQTASVSGFKKMHEKIMTRLSHQDTSRKYGNFLTLQILRRDRHVLKTRARGRGG